MRAQVNTARARAAKTRALFYVGFHALRVHAAPRDRMEIPYGPPLSTHAPACRGRGVIWSLLPKPHGEGRAVWLVVRADILRTSLWRKRLIFIFWCFCIAIVIVDVGVVRAPSGDVGLQGRAHEGPSRKWACRTPAHCNNTIK